MFEECGPGWARHYAAAELREALAPGEANRRRPGTQSDQKVWGQECELFNRELT
jgi:hypothetical protein